MPIFMNYEGVDGAVTTAGYEKAIQTSIAEPDSAGAAEPPGTGKTLTAALLGQQDGGDDLQDVITGAGPGAGPHVKVFDGTAAMDGDGDVDGRDFLTWQRGDAPATQAARSGGDEMYRTQYGNNNLYDAAAPAGDLIAPEGIDDPVAHGVTVLAWARVDGVSPSGDDVVVDGRIITAENPASTSAAGTHELGHTLGFRHEHGGVGMAEDDAADRFSFGDGATAAARLGGGDEDLLIGGQTGFDAFDPAFRGGVYVAATEPTAADSSHAGGVNVLFGDGSVRFFSDDVGLI